MNNILITVLDLPKSQQLWNYTVLAKVVLVLRKVARADPWVVITKGFAHTTLRSTRMTLVLAKKV